MPKGASQDLHVQFGVRRREHGLTMPLPVSAVDGGLSTSTNNGTGAAKLLSRSVAAVASHADTCALAGQAVN